MYGSEWKTQVKDGIFMGRRKHLLGKLIFFIGGAYAFILAAAVIHSIGGLGGLRESVEENIDSGQNLVALSSLYSKSAVLLDLDTGEIAAQKKSQDDCASGIGKRGRFK